MAEKKIIAVVGATGAQGGGLARAILSDKSGGFTARALTRDPNSDKASPLDEARAGAGRLAVPEVRLAGESADPPQDQEEPAGQRLPR